MPRRLVGTLAVLTLAAAMGAVAQQPGEQKPLPVALVEVLNKLSGGPHPGFRANHAKGVLVTGTFTPSKAASSLSSAPHLAQSVPVLVRFSDTTGVPTLPDASADASPHGMAIRFQLPGGGFTDIVSISANSFPVATPEDFLAFLQAVAASGPSVPKPTPADQFLATHPAAVKFVTTPRPPPASFATLTFFGVNAFKMTNSRGESHFIRYQIIPLAGEHALTPAAAVQADANYLMTELPRRLKAGAVEFRLLAQVAAAGDVTHDATVVWPADRERIELGVIRLTATVADQVKEQKALLYNPLALPSGIEPSSDPILLARPPAYAVSFTQRAAP